jgi:hypothetical protein
MKDQTTSRLLPTQELFRKTQAQHGLGRSFKICKMEVGQHAGTKTGVFIYMTSSNEWKCLWYTITGLLQPLLQKLLICEFEYVGYERLTVTFIELCW